jgi:hypothetical protein
VVEENFARGLRPNEGGFAKKTMSTHTYTHQRTHTLTHTRTRMHAHAHKHTDTHSYIRTHIYTQRAEVVSAVDWLTAQLRPRLNSWDSYGLVGAAVGLAKLDSYGLMENRDPAHLHSLLQVCEKQGCFAITARDAKCVYVCAGTRLKTGLTPCFKFVQVNIKACTRTYTSTRTHVPLARTHTRTHTHTHVTTRLYVASFAGDCSSQRGAHAEREHQPSGVLESCAYGGNMLQDPVHSVWPIIKHLRDCL